MSHQVANGFIGFRMSQSFYQRHEHLHPFVSTQFDDGVLSIGLGRQEDEFLWSSKTLECFCDLIQDVGEDQKVQVLVIHGAGLNFCKGWSGQASGMDIKGDAASYWFDRFELCCHRDLVLLPQPVLALVRGTCHFAGIQLLEGCDVVYADQNARFVIAQSDLNSMSNQSRRRSENLQSFTDHRLKTYGAMTDRSFDGSEAEHFGLVTQCFSSQTLMSELRSLTTTLCEKDALALQFTKETIAHVPSMTWDASVNFTAAKFAELKLKQSGQPSTRANAIASFLAGKSKPGKGE
jgi:enoyl-CoA hydratase/carnithine racemase